MNQLSNIPVRRRLPNSSLLKTEHEHPPSWVYWYWQSLGARRILYRIKLLEITRSATPRNHPVGDAYTIRVRHNAYHIARSTRPGGLRGRIGLKTHRKLLSSTSHIRCNIWHLRWTVAYSHLASFRRDITRLGCIVKLVCLEFFHPFPTNLYPNLYLRILTIHENHLEGNQSSSTIHKMLRDRKSANAFASDVIWYAFCIFGTMNAESAIFVPRQGVMSEIVRRSATSLVSIDMHR